MAPKDTPSHRRLSLIVGLCVLLGLLAPFTTATLAQNGVTSKGVQARMATMASARAAIETLATMMAGRIHFDRTQARAARKSLIAATRDIPSVFRKPHSDPLSRARPDIWIRWDDFESRAKTAKRMARALRVDRLGALRTTLPDMMATCLACHKTYRKPR